MDSNDLRTAIGRIRRAMPRNADVMLICDAAEATLIKPPVTLQAPLPVTLHPPVTLHCPACAERRRRNLERVRRHRAKPTRT